MFAPPGYTVMHHVESQFRRHAYTLFPKPVVPDFDSPSSNFTQYERAVSQLAEKRITAGDEAIARYLRNCRTLSVCKPGGGAFRISPKVVQREPGGKGSIPTKGFLFLDKNTWMVSMERADKWIADITRGNAQLAVEIRWREKIRQNLKADAMHADARLFSVILQRVPAMVEIFRPFEGASLVVADEEFPGVEEIERFFSAEEHEAETDGLSVIPTGRPRKQELALAAYSKIFPTGHLGKTWKEITQAVSKEARQPIGIDTMRRALELREAELDPAYSPKLPGATRRGRRGVRLAEIIPRAGGAKAEEAAE